MASRKLNRFRLVLILVVVISAYVYLVTRLFSVQLVSANHLNRLADKQYLMKIELSPERGMIYDRKGKELAISMDVSSVFAVPGEVLDKEGTIRILKDILDIDPQVVRERLQKDKLFVWIKRKISRDEKQALEEADVAGIRFITESQRFYPQGEMASHVLGFVNIDNEGQDGIEHTFDSYLQGEAGFRQTKKDAKRREIYPLSEINTSSRNGDRIYLTIDTIIQYIAEREIDAVFKKHNPESISIIVMDPQSGEIYAMANRPTFDPNLFHTADPKTMRNRSITDIYEPGSTFKIVTAAGALQEQLFQLDDIIDCENGEYKVPGRRRPLHDHHSYGELTFTQVIERSSNIGTVKMAQAMGAEALHRYVHGFGFGQLTQISLPGEQAGIFRELRHWTQSSLSAIPIGHEVAATSIQLACAFSVLANGGHMVHPHIVKRIENDDGGVIRDFEPMMKHRVLKPEISKTMRSVLQGVVSPHGTARQAYLEEYPVAGKTGTANKIDADKGGYDDKRFVASFIGFAPADQPAVVILVIVNDPPHKVRYGGTIAAPVFRDVARDVLRYLEGEGMIHGPAYPNTFAQKTH